MENINGKYLPPLMLLCATMGLAISVSLCFAQSNREAQVVTPPPFPCDILDPTSVSIFTNAAWSGYQRPYSPIINGTIA
jgi:hypothetical protein